MTIETWYPRCRKGDVCSPDDLDKALMAVLAAEPIDAESEMAAKGLVAFINRLHDIPGVQGVSFHNISQYPAGDNLYVGVLAPLCRGSEESANIVRDVGDAHADLAEAIEPFKGTGLSFYNGVHLEPTDFVRKLREISRRSRTKKLQGVFLFRH